MDISAPCRKGRSLLIILSAYDLRAGIDDGLTEFGVKANIDVRITIRAPPIMVISCAASIHG